MSRSRCGPPRQPCTARAGVVDVAAAPILVQFVPPVAAAPPNGGCISSSVAATTTANATTLLPPAFSIAILEAQSICFFRASVSTYNEGRPPPSHCSIDEKMSCCGALTSTFRLILICAHTRHYIASPQRKNPELYIDYNGHLPITRTVGLS